MEISTETQESSNAIYDANAEQRIEFVVTENGEKFDTAHKVKPVGEKEYLAFKDRFKGEIKAENGEFLRKTKKLTADLWDALIIEVENFELEEGQSLQDSIGIDEKYEVINKLLVVAIVESDKAGNGKRNATRKETETVTTEAYFNGVPVQQHHILRAKSDEWQKRFDRISRKLLKPETTKGLKREPKAVFDPQDEAFGRLYDEMFISNEGFENGNTPLRFKTEIVGYIFAPKFEEKK